MAWPLIAARSNTVGEIPTRWGLGPGAHARREGGGVRAQRNDTAECMCCVTMTTHLFEELLQEAQRDACVGRVGDAARRVGHGGTAG